MLRHLYSHYDDTVTVQVFRSGGSTTENIVVSRPHTFFVDGRGWVAAEALHAGDQIVTGVWDGSGDRPQLVAWQGPGPIPVHAGRATVGSVRVERKPLSAHNLTVDGFHTYLVGESGLWVHNSCASKILGQNLEEAGATRLEGDAAHHIVAANAPGAAESRALLDEAGIGINDAQNGVFLPGTSSVPNPTSAQVHSVVHTDSYYANVQSVLENAGGNISGALANIASQLKSGTFPH